MSFVFEIGLKEEIGSASCLHGIGIELSRLPIFICTMFHILLYLFSSEVGTSKLKQNIYIHSLGTLIA